MPKPRVQPRVFSGMRDFLPADVIRREAVAAKIRTAFEAYGYEPLETPAVEFYDILTRNEGDDNEKLIYRLGYKDGRTIALRYDLTVPLARVVAMRPSLPKPFKRYQIQPVWRADRPQKGRFREFMQCDVDAVGSDNPLFDAEIVAVTADALGRLGLPPFVVRISSRNLLSGVAAYAGVRGVTVQVPRRGTADTGDEESLVCVAAPVALFRAMDKVDKVGPDGVRAELEKLGFEPKAVERTLEVLAFRGADDDETLGFARRIVGEDEDGLRGVAEVETVVRGALDLGVSASNLRIDLSLARGLDYYTGPVYETVIEEPRIGSISGGGRYDELIGVFGGRQVPAAGSSLGFERIMAVLDEIGGLPEAGTRTRVLVARLGEETVGEALRVGRDLRRAGIATETWFETSSLRSQFGYAERKGIPYVVVVAPDELARGEVGVKDMKRREQQPVPRDEVASRVAALLEKTEPAS